MNRLHRIGLWMLVLLIGWTAASAQRGMPRQDRDARFDAMITLMTDKLDLTGQQVDEITAIHEDFIQAVDDLLEQDMDPAEKRQAMWDLRTQMQEDIEAVLTDGQLAIWQEIRPRRRPGRPGGPGFDRPGDRPGDRQQWRDNRRQMHEELLSYREENITPVLRDQRGKLDDALTQAEKNRIDEVRTQLEQLRTERGQGLQQGNRPGRGNRDCTGAGPRNGKNTDRRGLAPGNGGPGHHRIAHMLEMRLPDDYADMASIGEKYTEQIARLWMEIEDQHQQWRSDNEEIRKKYLPEGMDENRQRLGRGNDGTDPIGDDPVKEAEYKKVTFLLLLPADGVETGDLDLDIRIFPNPARDANSLSFTLRDRGNVSIELVDAAGNQLRQIENRRFGKGDHKVDVDLGGLAGNTYYYRITTEEGTTSVRFLKLEE